ncbi:MAG: recombinase RecT [Nitrosomonas sp.]|nr:recombinase RecT [Nitrosomonas sp.]
MSLQALKNINRNQASQPDKGSNDFPSLLQRFKGEIGRALPKHINPERMVRIALTAFRMNPKLSECDPRSVFAAVIQSSQLGLEVGLIGEAHLVPFKTECQLIPGYTGLMKLARQSGLVQDIYAHEVRLNDTFNLVLGLERSLEHQPMTAPGGFPAADEERGETIGFYAVAVFKDGSRTFVAMSRAEVERIRDGSRGYQASKRFKKESVWDSDFNAMGLKTVIRRLCKYLPKSPELATALALDALSEQGAGQHLDLVEAATGDFTPVVDEADVIDDTRSENDKPAQSSQSNKGPTLKAAIGGMEQAKSVAALDEVYIRLEADFEGDDLETLIGEYRRIKDTING